MYMYGGMDMLALFKEIIIMSDFAYTDHQIPTVCEEYLRWPSKDHGEMQRSNPSHNNYIYGMFMYTNVMYMPRSWSAPPPSQSSLFEPVEGESSEEATKPSVRLNYIQCNVLCWIEFVS